MKLLSLFSGIGAFEKALDRIGIDYEIINYCEIDKYASKAYSLINNVPESKNLGDITKINTSILPLDIDLITYGFPCQDISVAGNQKGFENNGELTRSGLFFEALRIIKNTQPKIAVAENVKNLTGKRFKNEFKIVLNSLEEAGYKNYWKVLNAKDYGIQQNRERVFIISIRKDLDNGNFTFPKGFDNDIRLKDILEETVDEKYYLSEAAVKKFKLFSKSKGTNIKVTGSLNPNKNVQDRVRVLDIEGISQGLRATDYKDPVKIVEGIDKSINDTSVIEYANCITAREDRGVSNRKSEGTAILEQVGQIYGTEKEPNPQAGRIYSGECLSPTISTCSGGNQMTKIIEVVANKCNNFVKEQIRIRKLTPKEYFRLMGFEDKDIDILIEHKISDTQLYKMAGNSIVIDVLVYLFKEIFNFINLEVVKMKKIEEVKTIKYVTNILFDIAALKEKEPDLFIELVHDYPCDKGRYIFEVRETV